MRRLPLSGTPWVVLIAATCGAFAGCKARLDAPGDGSKILTDDGTDLEDSEGYSEWGYQDEFADEFKIVQTDATSDDASATNLALQGDGDEAKDTLAEGDMV